MVNIKDIKNQIQEDVTRLACERFNLTENEVKVSFASSGELKVMIAPKDFIDRINCEVTVEVSLSSEEE